VTDPKKPAIGTTTEERIVNVVKAENEATRRHISGVFDTLQNDTSVTKTRMGEVKKLMKRLLNKFGIGSDDVP
jgi:hypothetical protein